MPGCPDGGPPKIPETYAKAVCPAGKSQIFQLTFRCELFGFRCFQAVQRLEPN